MATSGKDLQALGEYITSIINQDSSVAGNFNNAARKAGISPAELFALRRGVRQKPNPEKLGQLADAFNGDYYYMLELAGYNDGSQVDATKLSPTEKEFLVLARHVEDISSEELDELKEKLKDTIDLYLYKSKQAKKRG